MTPVGLHDGTRDRKSEPCAFTARLALGATAMEAFENPFDLIGGYRVAEDYGLTVSLEHTWFAVAAVRNVAKARSGSAARQDAGSLLARVTEVFLGARVQGATKPLALITPPAASYSAGFQYIPSAFLAETIFRKKQPQ